MDTIENVINSFKVNDVSVGGGNSYLDVDGKRFSTASHKKIEGERGEKRGTHEVNEHSQAVFKIIENVWVRKGLPIQEGVAPNFTVTVDLSPEFFVNIIRVIEKCEKLLDENTALEIENRELKAKNTSLANYAHDAKKARDEMENQLEQEKRRTAKLEQQIRESHPNYTPQPEDFIFTDVSYKRFWTDINTEPGYNGICRFLSTHSYSEQEEILQRLHKFQIPEDWRDTYKDFKWERANKEGKETATLREKLNGPLNGKHSIQELYKLVNGSKNAKKVIDYCLRCYGAGIQLRP